MASVIEKSLKEYEAYLNGEPNEVEVVEVTIPVVTEFNAQSIKELRKKINVTQAGLANLLGVSPRTVESWEANRTEPTRPVQKLLTLLTRNNDLAKELRLVWRLSLMKTWNDIADSQTVLTEEELSNKDLRSLNLRAKLVWANHNSLKSNRQHFMKKETFTHS